jgi:hypothetical protein
MLRSCSVASRLEGMKRAGGINPPARPVQCGSIKGAGK